MTEFFKVKLNSRPEFCHLLYNSNTLKFVECSIPVICFHQMSKDQWWLGRTHDEAVFSWCITENAHKGWHLSGDHLHYFVYSSEIEPICHRYQNFHFIFTHTQSSNVINYLIVVKYLYNFNYFQARWVDITILMQVGSALLTWRRRQQQRQPNNPDR